MKEKVLLVINPVAGKGNIQKDIKIIEENLIKHKQKHIYFNNVVKGRKNDKYIVMWK